MTFHESTIKKLRLSLKDHRDQLAEAIIRVEKRQQQLADAHEGLGLAERKAAVLTANVADCERWLTFAELCDADEELAHAFANAVLNREAEALAAKDAEAADDAMSASERHEHDQAAEAHLDAVAAVWSDAMFDDSEGGE